jgi:hypothetical protein
VVLADRAPEIMTALGELGLACIVKVDGERRHGQWTVVISGAPLAESFVRIDGNGLEYCLTKALRDILPATPAFD